MVAAEDATGEEEVILVAAEDTQEAEEDTLAAEEDTLVAEVHIT